MSTEGASILANTHVHTSTHNTHSFINHTHIHKYVHTLTHTHSHTHTHTNTNTCTHTLVHKSHMRTQTHTHTHPHTHTQVRDARAPPAVVLPCKAWGAAAHSSSPPSSSDAPALACADCALSVELREGDMAWGTFLELAQLPFQPTQPTPTPTQLKQPTPNQPEQSPWLHCGAASEPCNILFSSGTTVCVCVYV